MLHPSSRRVSLSVFLALLLAVPVYAVKTFKVSSYGNGHQIWFEAENFDGRNPDTEQYYKVVDHDGAFGQTVNPTGSNGGSVFWTFDISAAGGKGGTWYFFARVFNPSNRSDYLLVEGDPGDSVIPSGPPFPGGSTTPEVVPFTNADDQVFEETSTTWAWVRTNHSGGHTKELQNSKNTMRIYRREGNTTGFWDVFVWADDAAYRPTDNDYRNAAVFVPGVARGASPSLGATDVPRDVALRWKAGQFAMAHDVYFGTVFEDVNAATRTDAKGVLAGPGQDQTTFDPPGVLAYGKTYYWRVDEVNKTPDQPVFKGDVWSFTVEPYGYPVAPIAATAASSQANMGPEKTIDRSGLTGDLHNAVENMMWLSDMGLPTWIQYEFDKVYSLDSLQVWNSNQPVESFMGFGAKSVTIETSLDGVTWTPVPAVPEFTQAPGMENYAANTTVHLGGAEAKYVKLTINSNWGGLIPQAGLAEVRFSYVPLRARMPQPATGATAIEVDATLDWRPGRTATSHTVYLGTDPNAVTAGTVAAKTVTDHSFSPGPLNLATTYYWRVDEVNGVAAYAGDVWSFSTQPYLVVDDFESYTDVEGHAIWQTWADGLENPANGGSRVGNDPPPYAELTIVRGGKQAMPLFYASTATATYSEAVRTFASPQDWTAHGIKSLVLWFQGKADNSGQLYVKINNTKIAYPGNAGDIATTGWMHWSIDLSAVAGGLSNVTKLTLGVEGTGAQGTLYVDDVQLSPTVLVPVTQPAITAVVRANGQSATQTTAVLVKTYTGSTTPVRMTYGLQDGAFVFSDRIFTWVNTPPALVGAEYIPTFNQDKSSGETDVTYTVTFGRAATVFVGCDDRFSPNQQATVDHAVAAFAQPGQFKDTGPKLYYSDGTTLLSVSVFTADLPAGTYVFGSQVGNCFYTIGVMPK